MKQPELAGLKELKVPEVRHTYIHAPSDLHPHLPSHLPFPHCVPCWHTQVVRQWQERKITNLEYLSYLNSIADRSYNDLTQYPVFPWCVSFLEWTTSPNPLNPPVYQTPFPPARLSTDPHLPRHPLLVLWRVKSNAPGWCRISSSFFNGVLTLL